MSVSKIQETKNYQLFERHSGENRPLDLKKHKKLLESMRRYGFLRCFPIVVVRDAAGKLIVKDGQHRLMIGETLALPIFWVEADEDFDVALVNSAAKPWQLRDYAQKHAANGLHAYQDGLDFAESHRLPLGTAFALLAGTISFDNCQEVFINGTFKVKDLAWAEAVASLYGPLVVLGPAMKNSRLIEACMAACRVKEFDANRLIAGAERCREKLVAFSTRDAYLDLLEFLYNYGRKNLVGLKAAAVMAMRERCVSTPKKKAS